MAGPIAGLFSVGYVRLITWAERHKPENWRRIVVPVVGLGLLGVVSIRFPQILGNGKDVSQLAFDGQVPMLLLLTLVAIKPFATILFQVFVPSGLDRPRFD